MTKAPKATEWFRRTTWSSEDASEFEARLQRARSTSRAQYLRIQAVHLTEASPPLPKIALQLLRRMETEYPDNGQLAMAYEQMGACLEMLGDKEAARDSYYAAIKHMRVMPYARTASWASFARLVWEDRKVSLYDEALFVLDEHSDDRSFPINRFCWHAYRALLLTERDGRKTAQDDAKAALEAAAEHQSEFRYHRHLGLVGPKYDPIVSLLQTLVD